MKRAQLALAILFVTVIAGSAYADAVSVSDPASLGFSPARLGYIDQFYSEQVNRRELSGLVLLIARHGRIAHFSAIGYADVESKRTMTRDTIFRLYSMTKPIASVALMTLYEEGRFQLTDPISKYIPQFADLQVQRSPEGPTGQAATPIRPPTVQDALRHTAGFTHELGSDILDVPLAEMMTKLSRKALRDQPGTKWVYSIGPDIAARLVEVLSGIPFDAFLEERIFRPLGMLDTGFWVRPDKASRLATVYWRKDGRLIPLDAVHGSPPNGDLLAQPQYVNSYTVNHRHKGGSFGLVGTVEDYWRFAQMMLNGGQLNGMRILSPHTVAYMTRDHLGKINADEMPIKGAGFGLGFGVIKDPPAAGFLSSEGTFFWGGAAETHFWVDPKADMVVVAMTQRLGDTQESAETLFFQLRTLVYGALVQ